MLKFLSLKKEYVSYVLVLMFGLLMSGMAAYATTTISTNVTTQGTLAVTGVSTLTGTVLASSTIVASGNIMVNAGYGLDTSVAGVLNIGTTTASAITIGSASIVTSLPGTASTSKLIINGGTTVNNFLWGNCSVAPTSVAATSTATGTCTAAGTKAGDQAFVTGPSNLEYGLVLVGATTTTDTITLKFFNTSTTTIAATAKPWSYMVFR